MNGEPNGHEADELEILEEPSHELVPVDAEVSTMIATAKRFPRSIARATKLAMAMATMDEDTAAACFYNLPRGGKRIQGPSARLAEIAASSWGNIRFGAEVLDNDDKHVMARGMCWDLESNVAFQVKVRRRITNKDGRTYDEDMIAVTGNAANSIAMRNAVLKVIPTVFWKRVYDAARKVAIGDATTLSARRQAAIDYFAKLGVDVGRVCAAVQKGGIEELGLDELELLTGLKTAIKDGDTTIDEAFPVDGAGGSSDQQPRRKSETKAAKAETKPAAETKKEPPAETKPATSETPAASSAASNEGGKQAPVSLGEPDDNQAAPERTTTLETGSKIVHAQPAAEPAKPAEKPDFKLISEIMGLVPQVDKKNGEKGSAKAMMVELYSVDSATKLTAENAREFVEILKQSLAAS